MKLSPQLVLICLLVLLVAPAPAQVPDTNTSPDPPGAPPCSEPTTTFPDDSAYEDAEISGFTDTTASVDTDILWQRCLGGDGDDRAYSITGTMDGGYAIAGLTNSRNGDVSGCHFYFDCWVVKLNSAGELDWQKCLGGMFVDEAHCIIQTTDGGYVVTGFTSSTDGDVTGKHGEEGYSDVWMVRLDSSGNIEWQKCLGGSNSESAMSIRQTTDGGYVVAGYTDSQDGDVNANHGKNDYWVVKLSETGAIEWQKCLGGSGNDYAQCIIQTTDGGYAVAGSTNSQDGDVTDIHSYETDCWVVKLNETGTMEWQKCLGGRNYDEAYSIIQTPDGGYAVAGFAGSTFGDVEGHIGGKDFWVVRLDTAGTIVWQKCLGGVADDVAQSIIPTPDGGYVISGWTSSCCRDVSGQHGKADYWVVRLDATGELEWQKCLGGSEDDYAQGIIRCFDGSYVVGGWTASTDDDVSGYYNNNDFWVVRFSPDGLPAPPSELPAPTAQFDLNRTGVAQTENNTFTPGTYHTTLTYLLHAENTDAAATQGNLTFVVTAENITWVDHEQYATWNATRAEWTFPPEYTLPPGSGQDVQAGTSYTGEAVYTHTCTRTCNKTIFHTDGVQHTNVSVTFDELDFESVFVGFATAQDANVTTEIIQESVETNAPLIESLFADGPHHLQLDTAGLVTGSEYYVTFDTRISLNTTPVEHIPQVCVLKKISHESAVVGETYRTEVPANMLPTGAGEFSIETNTSSNWTVVRHNNLISILNGSLVEMNTPLPVANFTASPQGGNAPLSVTFSDTSENACEWFWNFGDNATSAEQNPVHTYGEPGRYTVTLTVSNPVGSDTLTRMDSVTVYTTPAQSVSSGGGNGPGTTAVSASENVKAGLPVTFAINNGPARAAEITFSEDHASVLVTVLAQTTLPAGVNEQPPTRVYQYLTYTLYRASPDDVTSARIDIAVPLPLISDGDACLFQYREGEWTPLSTNKTGEESGCALFSAETSSLSTFAITFSDPASGSPEEKTHGEENISEKRMDAEEGEEDVTREDVPAPLPTTSPGGGLLITTISLAAVCCLAQRK